MSKIVLPIDTKSLYLNIFNDNLAGHTATVATPLKQGNSYNEELGQLLTIKDKEIYFQNKPELINEMLKNSKSFFSLCLPPEPGSHSGLIQISHK